MNTKNTDTIGIDLGDPSHEACTLNKAGEVTATITLLNCRSELEAFSAQSKGTKIILEAGTQCALKRAGLKRAGSGGKTDKKKAVVKTARKTAVLLLALLKNPETDYIPFPEQPNHPANQKRAT